MCEQELRLDADAMPYAVEAGSDYNSYHDLVGEIPPDKPANAGYVSVPVRAICADGWMDVLCFTCAEFVFV